MNGWVKSVQRYRLRTLIIVVAIAAGVFLFAQRWLEQRPLRWIPYSQQSFAAADEGSSPVILMFGADSDIGSGLVQLIFEQELKSVARKRGYTLFYVDMTSPNAEGEAFLKKYGAKPTVPVVIVFPDGVAGKQVVLDSLPNAKDILNAMQ